MKGFTLLEMLITIAIMGILTGIGVTSFNISLQKSRDAERKSDLNLIAKALVAWAGDFGQYPSDDGNGKILGCDPNDKFVATGSFQPCSWGSSFVAFINGGQQLYLSKLPGDPSYSYHYYYKKTDSGFDLFSILENSSDSSYKIDAGASANFPVGTITCAAGKNCNYWVSEGGVQ